MLKKIYWKALLEWHPRLRGYLRGLDEFAASDPQRRYRWQVQRLQSQLRYFSSLPFADRTWKEAAKIADPKEFMAAWENLPVLSKGDLNSRFSAFAIQSQLPFRGRIDSTGGSTGEPTFFIHDREMAWAATAVRFYARLRQGWRPDMPTICLWGSERDIGRQRSRRGRFFNWLENNHLLDGYHLTPATALQVCQLVRQHAPVALFGFSSMLDFLARETLRQGISFSRGEVALAWNGGEMLFPQMSERFQQAFGVPILNYYGGRELSGIAFQPESHAPLRLMRPWIFAELLDDNNRPVPPRTPGRLVLTHTACRGTPFLRYDIGDLAEYEEGDRDLSGLISLRALLGREAGLLTLPDGRTINCIFWNHLFKEYPEIHQFQVVLQKRASLLIRFKGPGFSAECEQRLRHTLNGFLQTTPYEIVWLPQLPLTAQGKLLQVIRE